MVVRCRVRRPHLSRPSCHRDSQSRRRAVSDHCRWRRASPGAARRTSLARLRHERSSAGPGPESGPSSPPCGEVASRTRRGAPKPAIPRSTSWLFTWTTSRRAPPQNRTSIHSSSRLSPRPTAFSTTATSPPITTLVAMKRLTGSQPQLVGDVFSAMTWFATEPQEVRNLRDQYDADMVALFIPTSWTQGSNACGVALLPEADGGVRFWSGDFNERAFSVMRDGCGLNDYTFAHELGHNFGMRHDNENTSSPPHLFANGRGTKSFWFFSGEKATVMGCLGDGSGDPLGAVLQPPFLVLGSLALVGNRQSDPQQRGRRPPTGRAVLPLPLTRPRRLGSYCQSPRSWNAAQ